MKPKLLTPIIVLIFLAQINFSQTVANNQDQRNQLTLEKISDELSVVSKSLQTFNQRMNEFLESVNKYKGIQLSERQQKLLFGYEILNQTEQLAATLRKSLIETGECEATIKRRLGQIQFDLRPENIEKSIQFQGTTKADEARENRRRTLENERNALQNVLDEVETSKAQIIENLRSTEIFAQSFRKNLFAQIKDAMEDFQ